MTTVWILTLLINYGGHDLHHYADEAIFASKEKCEDALFILKEPPNPIGDKIECREVEVRK